MMPFPIDYHSDEHHTHRNPTRMLWLIARCLFRLKNETRASYLPTLTHTEWRRVEAMAICDEYGRS